MDAPLESAGQALVAAPSVASDMSSQAGFDGEARPVNVQALMRCCNVLAGMFLACSVVTFCSSAYTGPGSALDSILVMVDVMTIDISSALFVSAGFTATGMYLATDPATYDAMTRTTACSLLIDLFAATAASLLLGSLNALLMHDFKWQDVGFTLLDGVTTLRGIDFRQTPSAPHAYNMAAWPVQSMVWCILTTKSVYAFDEIIVTRFPALCDVIICLMALVGIILFTVFGPMQSSSNIFYANACSVTYRSLEFNLGVHMLFMYRRHPVLVAVLNSVVRKAWHFVALFFVTVWWSEIGQPVTHSAQTTCLRLYFRNPCLQDHHAFFLRGCLLAVVLLMAADTDPPHHLAREMRMVKTNCSAMAFCWPVCIAVKLVLDVTFGSAVIAASRAVLSVLCLSLLGVLAFFYNALAKPPLLAFIAQLLKRPETQPYCPGIPHQ